MAHNVIVFPAWRIELPERADAPADDDFLTGLRELRAELAECTRDLSSVRAGIAEVRAEVDGLIEKVATQRDKAAPRWLGCDGPDGLGCDVLGCRCDCGIWDGICDHPLTPDEIARLDSYVGGPCACFART